MEWSGIGRFWTVLSLIKFDPLTSPSLYSHPSRYASTITEGKRVCVCPRVEPIALRSALRPFTMAFALTIPLIYRLFPFVDIPFHSHVCSTAYKRARYPNVSSSSVLEILPVAYRLVLNPRACCCISYSISPEALPQEPIASTRTNSLGYGPWPETLNQFETKLNRTSLTYRYHDRPRHPTHHTQA